MQKRIKSVIPIYLMGIAFLLYSLIFPLYRITDILIATGISILIYFLLNKVFPGKIIDVPKEVNFERSGDSGADAMLSQGRSYIKRLSELDVSINDEEISRQINNLIDISTQIFDFISKNPGHARKINTFMDYYYPTALKFLESYAEFDSKTIKSGNISASMQKISDSLSKIEEAFEHQLDNLYSDKALDITTDIAVLESIMAREGMD